MTLCAGAAGRDTLRVAILCFGTVGRGGMETVIATTLRQFELDGDVPRLFLLGGSADLSWILGLPVTVLGSASDAKFSRYSQYILRLPWMLRSFAPDVVLCADPRTVLVASVIKKMLRLRTKVVSWLLGALLGAGAVATHLVPRRHRRRSRHRFK